MSEQINRERRLILGKAILGVAAMEFALPRSAFAQAAQSADPAPASSSRRLEPVQHVDAGVLNIAYYEEGPADGPVVMLLHGFPYDIHSYVDVAPMLAAKGCRTIVPYLRGYGPTRFRDKATPRSGEQAALGADLRFRRLRLHWTGTRTGSSPRRMGKHPRRSSAVVVPTASSRALVIIFRKRNPRCSSAQSWN
jgi:hypothetical protein